MTANTTKTSTVQRARKSRRQSTTVAGLDAETTTLGDHSADAVLSHDVSPRGGASGLIASYNPLKSKFPICTKEEWAAIAPLVRTAVGQLEGLPDRAHRPYLTAMTRLATWAHREGLDLEIPVVLTHSLIEAHIATLDSGAGTFRSQLRRLAAANGVKVEDTSARYGRRAYSQPYTLEEVKALVAYAKANTNELRRKRILGFVLLGAGCGICRGELRQLGRDAVHEHDGALHVTVSSRCVPVLDPLQDDLKDFLSWCGDEPFIGPEHSTNAINRIPGWVHNRAGVPDLNGDRLRAFFIVEHLRAGTSPMRLLAISGLVFAAALDPYLSFLPTPHTSCEKAADKSQGASS